MSRSEVRPPLSRDELIEWLRREGEHRYHDHHRYHVLMHEGKLSKLQLQQWVLNRYYYQTRIPIKDAIIVAKSSDPAFRRMWIRRIQDHDGAEAMAHLPVGGPDGSLAALSDLRGPRRRIYIHINNTNPMLREDSPERAAVSAAGWEVAWDGMTVELR